MPELPEVETVKRGLAPTLEGAQIERLELRRADLRFPFPADLADRASGQRIVALSRRAKYLLADLASADVLIMHLGMSGSFRIEDGVVGAFHHPRSKAATHDHVVMHLSGGTRVIYNDPRRFGFMTIARRGELEDHALFRGLGPEPLGNALDTELLAARFKGRRTPIKAALLDQGNIAGLGNIYVCEALYRAGIHPTRPSGSLTADEIARLLPLIRIVLEEAIQAGGSSIADHAQPSGDLGYFQHSFRVYDREGEPCRTEGCNGRVLRMVQAGRSSFYCENCQR